MADAREIVHDYLTAMERRDLDTARALVADGAEIVFPGGYAPKTLEEIVEGSARRYREVKKRFEGTDVFEADGRTIVYVYGMLYGAWLDGEKFDDIRFIDRFELDGGRIVSQRVWNDSGEARAAREAKAAAAMAT